MSDVNNQFELTDSPELEEWLQLVGVGRSYIDFDGQDVPIPMADRLRVLRLMGECPDTQKQLEDSLETGRVLSTENPLPRRSLVADQNWCVELNFHQPRLSNRCRWELRTESGSAQHGEFSGTELSESGSVEQAGEQFSLRLWELPVREAGYHQLRIETEGQTRETLLICAPGRCHEPSWLLDQQRLGGLSVQVYELCSEHNWGIGDFHDLQDVITRAAAHGVEFIVLNPLHALDLKKPEQCSPYSPMDRRYLNPLYLDLEAVPEFADCETAQKLVTDTDFQARLQQLRTLPHVDYSAVADIKLSVLLLLYAAFCRSGSEARRRLDYQNWVSGKGAALSDYAEFEARRHSDYTDSRRKADFHSYLQFLADEQLAQCQQLAFESGMALGLVRDLAVGSTRKSAEVLLNPELFCAEASVGAPPDVFAPQGQNWGLPPMKPRQLESSGFAHYIELLRDNMQYCGALRIDHVMALMRLWWSPSHHDDGAGAYVHYPVDALFAILRLESVRRQCVIIGEDLGVVPPEIRQHMNDSAVLSNLLFFFEKYDSVHFKKPEHFPERTLAMVANHDVPTLRAWWERTDIELRQQIGLLAAGEEHHGLLSSRESDLIQILHWLQEQDLLPQTWQDFNIHRPFDQALCTAILRANGRAAAQLVSIQLADLELMPEPVNIPGTSSQYPNWRRKMHKRIDEVFTQPDSLNMLSAFVAARNGLA